MELFKLFGSILVDSDAAENSISKAGDKADGLGKKLGAGIVTAAKFGVGLAAGAAVAGAGLFALATKSAETADVIDKLSERTGINREELQRWKYAADQSGADIGKLETGVKKLSDVMVEASSGNEKATDAFDKLGISMDDLKNKSQEQIFEETMTALADMEQGAERNALGNDLLGKSYTEMLPLLNAGSGGMQDLKDRADELGIVMSEEAVKANVVFGDTMDDVKDSLGAVGMKVGTELLPMFQGMLNWVLGNMPTIQAVARTVFDAVATTIQKVATVFRDEVLPRLQDFWSWLEPKLPALKLGFETAFSGAVTAIKGVIDTIQEASKWVKDHWVILEPILAGIAGGAIAFYAITGALAVYNAAILFASGVGPIYTAVTAAMATATAAFGAAVAFVTSPIFLIVLAIGALIAIGVLLYKNWDVVKEKTGAAWNWIKDKSINIFNGMMDFFKKWGTTILVVIGGPIAWIAALIYKNWDTIKQKTSSVWGAIKNAMMNPIETAKNKIKGIIETIKGFFTNMKLKLPNIKTPHFKFKNWSINPADWIKNMPSIGIDWYAKGALFTKPTLFNTPQGMKGFGEAGPEAALPLNSSVLGMIGQKISDTMSTPAMGFDNRPIIIQVMLPNGQALAEATLDANQLLFGSASKSNAFMNGVR